MRDRLLRETGGYVLRVSAAEVDLGEFRILAMSGRRAAARGDLAGGALLLEQALHMWRDCSLPDLPRNQTTNALRRRLHAELASVHDALLCVLACDGRWADSLALIDHRVTHALVDEDAWLRYLEALYRSGRRAEALSSYRHLARNLAAEHGLDPGPRLKQMHARLLTDDASLGAAESDVATLLRHVARATDAVTLEA